MMWRLSGLWPKDHFRLQDMAITSSKKHRELLQPCANCNVVLRAQNHMQDMAVRGTKKQYELLWRGAKSYGSSADVITGNFASGEHITPAPFSFQHCLF